MFHESMRLKSRVKISPCGRAYDFYDWSFIIRLLSKFIIQQQVSTSCKSCNVYIVFRIPRGTLRKQNITRLEFLSCAGDISLSAEIVAARTVAKLGWFHWEGVRHSCLTKCRCLSNLKGRVMHRSR